jgi:hypothetical protein
LSMCSRRACPGRVHKSARHSKWMQIRMFLGTQTRVTVITDPDTELGDTPIVNMVRREQESPLGAGRHGGAVERGSRRTFV